MANKIEILDSPRPIDGFVTATSRYANSTILRYGDANRLTFTLYKKKYIKSKSTDKVSVIPPGMEYRPDLVSNKAYGTPDFWWKILEANAMMDIFEFKSGLTIRIPDNLFI